jgi:hypothetical protein
MRSSHSKPFTGLPRMSANQISHQPHYGCHDYTSLATGVLSATQHPPPQCIGFTATDCDLVLPCRNMRAQVISILPQRATGRKIHHQSLPVKLHANCHSYSVLPVPPPNLPYMVYGCQFRRAQATASHSLDCQECPQTKYISSHILDAMTTQAWSLACCLPHNTHQGAQESLSQIATSVFASVLLAHSAIAGHHVPPTLPKE